MKIRIFALFMIAALLITGCAAKPETTTSTLASSSTEKEEPTMNTFTPNWNNVKPLGRTHQLEESLWLAFSGSGAEFTFTGSYCEVIIQGDSNAHSGAAENLARIAIEVDGERVVDDMIDAKEKNYVVISGGDTQNHVVRILKLSETAMSTCGVKAITVDAASIQPTPLSDYYIEFVGDSITCGYGVDDPVKEHHFSTATEDVTKAYAYKTAQALGADYSMVSISGYGIISGYSDGENKSAGQLLPTYYTKLGFSYGTYQKTKADTIPWDFSVRQPDLIVVNLGTNDDSYTLNHRDRQEEFAAGYVEFLKVIRSNNPDAKILCTLGIMGDRLYTWIEKAVADYTTQTGDSNIACMRFDVQKPADGYAADWHPTEATHEKAAQRLADTIRQLMGW